VYAFRSRLGAMRLPAALTERIEEADRALFRHSERELLPWYRYAIYTALAEAAPAQAGRMRAWLDIVAVRHIQFCWQPAPSDGWPPAWPVPEQLLALAERLLTNAADRNAASAQLGRAHAIADIVGAAPTAPEYPSWCVYEAALRALESAWSAVQSVAQALVPATTDCHDDASRYAAIAVAGGTWGRAADGIGRWDVQTEDAQLRRAVFWEWWLHEAIAIAWAKGAVR
jgi:hypothetical protein